MVTTPTEKFVDFTTSVQEDVLNATFTLSLRRTVKKACERFGISRSNSATLRVSLPILSQGCSVTICFVLPVKPHRLQHSDNVILTGMGAKTAFAARTPHSRAGCTSGTLAWATASLWSKIHRSTRQVTGAHQTCSQPKPAPVSPCATKSLCSPWSWNPICTTWLSLASLQTPQLLKYRFKLLFLILSRYCHFTRFYTRPSCQVTIADGEPCARRCIPWTSGHKSFPCTPVFYGIMFLRNSVVRLRPAVVVVVTLPTFACHTFMRLVSCAMCRLGLRTGVLTRNKR